MRAPARSRHFLPEGYTEGSRRMGWFPKFKIAQKLPLALVGSALLVSAGVGIASYLIGSSTVDQMSIRQMQMAAGDRVKSFETYLGTIEADLVNQAAAESVQTTLRDFAIGWGQFATAKPAADPIATLRANYIDNNPNAQGSRQALDTPEQAPGAKKWNYDFRLCRPVPVRPQGQPRLLGNEERRLRAELRRRCRARR